MKKSILMLVVATLLFSGCAQEFNHVYRSDDYRYKYEYAKECYLSGKYSQAITLLEGLVTLMKGGDSGEECLYMLGMAQYNYKDYESSAMTFKKYFSTYPKGKYAEMASFYIGESQYMSTPEPRLDQTETVHAINSFQNYLDFFPEAQKKTEAHDRLFELQDKLVMKELHTAQLYYDLGTYFGNCGMGGNNYEACIITAQNALKDFPFTDRREDFSLLVMKGKYELAQMSVEEKKTERYQDAEDECYGFINEYPDSKHRNMAERFIRVCKNYTDKHPSID